MGTNPPQQPPSYPPPQQQGYTPQPPYGQPPYRQPPYPQPPYAQQYGPPKTNGLAVAGFILSLLIFTSFIGIGLSVAGLLQINSSYGRQKGKGLAIAGIIIGAIGFVLGMILR